MATKKLIKSFATYSKMCNKIVQPRKAENETKGKSTSLLSDSPIDYDSLDLFRKETDQFLKKRELRRQEMSYIDSLVKEAWVIASKENAKLIEVRRQQRIRDRIQKKEQEEDAEIAKLKLQLEAEDSKQANAPLPPPPVLSIDSLDEPVKKPRSVKVYRQQPIRRHEPPLEGVEPVKPKIGFSDPYYCTAAQYSQYCCRPYRYLTDEANLDPMNMSNLQQYDDRSHFFEFRPQWVWKRPSNLQMQRVWLRGKYDEEK